MTNVVKSLKNVCLCTVFNVLLISFIVIISFYLIRRINRINLKKSVENFRVSKSGGIGGVCKPVIQNKINMNQLAGPLNGIANSLASIDAKLDFVNGFKTIKNDSNNKTKSVHRKNYPFGKGDSKKSKQKQKSKEEQDREDRAEIRKNIMKEKNEERKENLKEILKDCYNLPINKKETICSKTYEYGIKNDYFKLDYKKLPNNFDKNTKISLICKDSCNI